MKRLLAMMLTLLLLLSLMSCGAKKEEPVKEEETKTEEPAENAPTEETTPEDVKLQTADFRIAALKGPTAMGLVKLMDDAEKGETENGYTFTLAGAADEVTPLLMKGELDLACVPANLASVLYNKTEGQMQVLAVNTLGVIYIVEKGETIESMEDLRGKTIVGAGKGSTPEFGFRYLLKENGIDPDTDLTIDWKSEHAECVAALAADQATIALLPQPFVTVAKTKVEGLRTALSLTEEWDALENGSTMITGVVVARKGFVEENPEAVELFLQDYAESVSWVNSHVEEAAEMIGNLEIVAAGVAKQALPYCNIVCMTHEEMKEKLSGYLQVLADQEPASVGGKVPGEDFYF